MRIKEIDDIISQCNVFLGTGASREGLLESYLNQFLLVKIYQAFEDKIREIVHQRADIGGDIEMANFVKFSNKKFRGILTSDLQKTLLEKFSKTYSTEFQRKVSVSDIGQSYNSIIANRHAISHTGNPIYATYEDTVKAYEVGHKVLDILKEVFGVQ